MADNTSPLFAKVPRIEVAALAAANAARDGSGTVTSLVTGSANKTRIDTIKFISSQATAAANSAMVGRVFLTKDNGSTWTLFDEVDIGAVTASNTAKGAQQTLNYPLGIILADANHKIGVTISVYAGVQDRVAVVARGADLGA